jgi:hypothetical protein
MTESGRASRVWRWLLGPQPGAAPGAEVREDFPGGSLPASLGEEILSSSPARGRFRTAIRDLIGDFTRDEKRELVDRVLVRFALWVVDLPASEKHHDSGPFGHLDHALRVAHSVVQAISHSTLRLSHDPVLDARERPPWIYAGFLAALLHDTGKLFDLEVSSPDGKEEWNSPLEPLAAFLGRHGLRRTPKERLRFLPGRGLKAHREKLRAFLPLIPTRESQAFVGKRLFRIADAYTAPGELPPHVPEAAREIAALLKSWDREESIQARAEEAPKPSPPEKEPAPAVVPPTPPPPAEKELVRDLPAPPRSSAIPWQDLSGSKPNFMKQDLTAARILKVLGHQICTGHLLIRGDSARVFVRPDLVWFVSPDALVRVAEVVDFAWRPDLNHKMLALLARAGALRAFGPDRYLALVRPVPGTNRLKRAFRVSTSTVIDESTLKTLHLWEHEVEIAEPAGEAGDA